VLTEHKEFLQCKSHPNRSFLNLGFLPHPLTLGLQLALTFLPSCHHSLLPQSPPSSAPSATWLPSLPLHLTPSLVSPFQFSPFLSYLCPGCHTISLLPPSCPQGNNSSTGWGQGLTATKPNLSAAQTGSSLSPVVPTENQEQSLVSSFPFWSSSHKTAVFGAGDTLHLAHLLHPRRPGAEK
jgi:hypothetical protein